MVAMQTLEQLNDIGRTNRNEMTSSENLDWRQKKAEWKSTTMYKSFAKVKKKVFLPTSSGTKTDGLNEE